MNRIKPGLRLSIPAVVFALFTLAHSLAALDVPRLSGRINDYADMISGRVETELDTKLRTLEESDSTQVVVLTIPSLKGEALEDYSIRVAETWGIGQKDFDNGVLLLVSKNDRKLRIEVGYGLEGVLTDLLSGRIIDNEITPHFKTGRFDQGFTAGVDAIIQAVKGEYKGTGKPKMSVVERSGASFMPFIILFIVISVIGSKKRIIGGIAGALLLPLVVLFAFPFGLVMILAMIPLGFLGGIIAPGMYFFSGMGRRGSGGGGFSSGGFSGGGGGFGGGGASGGW